MTLNRLLRFVPQPSTALFIHFPLVNGRRRHIIHHVSNFLVARLTKFVQDQPLSIMDPASAIGVASGVLTFIDFTSKFISTINGIYNSSSGQTMAHETLEDVTRKMRELSERLVFDKPSLELSSDEIVINSLASHCSQFAHEIIVRLERTKVKKGHSLIQSVKAASKIIWTKEEVNSLQENLDRCVGHLLLQWTVVQRYVEELAALYSQSNISRRSAIESALWIDLDLYILRTCVILTKTNAL